MVRWMLQWRYIRRGRWFKHRKSKLTSWVLREVSSLESFTAIAKSTIPPIAKSSIALFWLSKVLRFSQWCAFHFLEESLGSTRPNIKTTPSKYYNEK
ncbi:hypothetical protein Bca52824_046161 [Brassica carinata]|uniref:Uncharacterized protein n=1 Tax=Brassica carinata TaxID=52824 RepID=A0A8X7REY9_BRACI|nr:hypothetical protein Bca52824_046161 [Brassica carinata]